MTYTLVMHGEPILRVGTLEVCLEPHLPSGEAHWYAFHPGLLFCGKHAYGVLKALPEAKQKELTFPDLTARPT